MAIVVALNNSNKTVKVQLPSQTTAADSAVTLKNVALGVTRLDQMVDVVEGTPTDNATLVYNAENDKYEVKQLNLDGGTF